MKMALEYDGKRPASLDYFLRILDIKEEEFIEILQKNEVSHWGFDKKSVIKGKPLHDAEQWDYFID